MEIGDYVKHKWAGFHGKIISMNGPSSDIKLATYPYVKIIRGSLISSLSLITDQTRIHEIKLELSGNKL